MENPQFVGSSRLGVRKSSIEDDVDETPKHIVTTDDWFRTHVFHIVVHDNVVKKPVMQNKLQIWTMGCTVDGSTLTMRRGFPLPHRIYDSLT